MKMLWFLYAFYFISIVADVVTTHYGLQLWAVKKTEFGYEYWKLQEGNLHFIALWSKIGYVMAMLLKIALAGFAGLCILLLSGLARRKPPIMSFLVVLFVLALVFNFYIVGTNVLDIIKIRTMKEV